MDLLVSFAARSVPGRGPGSCGVVITHRNTERIIHEAGYFLGTDSGIDLAPVQALLQSLDLVAEHSPELLVLSCPHIELIDQITTADLHSDPLVCELQQQALMKLLRFDHWQITRADAEPLRRPRELAEAAMREATDTIDLTHTEAATRQASSHTGVPQWVVELLESPGPDCPARCEAGRRYPFGPDTPAGFCVHAARVALEDGPLTWVDGEQVRMTTICPVCEAPLRIERVG